MKCRIDYYLALAGPANNRNKIVFETLETLNLLARDYLPRVKQLLRARLAILVGTDDIRALNAAKNQLDLILAGSDIAEPIYFRAAIEKFRLAETVEPKRLDKLSQVIADSSCKDDFELNVALAFLRYRNGFADSLETVVEKWPASRSFFGRVLWLELLERYRSGQLLKERLESLSLSQARWAAQAGLQFKGLDRIELLARLADEEKFQESSIHNCAGAACKESRPVAAIEYLVKASRVKEVKESQEGQLDSIRFAQEAAQLGYELFSEDSNFCIIAEDAFANYCQLAGEEINDHLEYYYSIVLNHCGQNDKASALLERIADQPAGKFAGRARYDLILKATQVSANKSPQKHQEFLRQLEGLISDMAGDEEFKIQVRRDAIILYCQLLVESQALYQLDKAAEAVELLALAVEPNCCDYVAEVLTILRAVISRIDEYQARENDFELLLKNCQQLARYCFDCSQGSQRRQGNLILAELAIFSAGNDNDKLTAAEDFLNTLGGQADKIDVDLLRCRARLQMRQRKFGSAGRLWLSICDIHRKQALSTDTRSWYWWRAKFYQLDCWSKMAEAEAEEVLHCIEVLQNSFTDIPSFWAKRLNLLRMDKEKELSAASSKSLP